MFEIQVKKHKPDKYMFSIRLNGFIVEELYDIETEQKAKDLVYIELIKYYKDLSRKINE